MAIPPNTNNPMTREECVVALPKELRPLADKVLKDLEALQHSTRATDRAVGGTQERLDRIDDVMKEVQHMITTYITAEPEMWQPLMDRVSSLEDAFRSHHREASDVYRPMMRSVKDDVIKLVVAIYGETKPNGTREGGIIEEAITRGDLCRATRWIVSTVAATAAVLAWLVTYPEKVHSFVDSIGGHKHAVEPISGAPSHQKGPDPKGSGDVVPCSE